MDKYVEKRHLTSRKGTTDAGFNKMPVLQAKINPSEINHLHMHYLWAADPYAAQSYKNDESGISRQSAVIFRHFHAFLARSRTSMRTLSGTGPRTSRRSASSQAHSSKCLSMAGVMKRLRAA